MANPITSTYRFVRNILYGYPDYSPIYRREFVRALAFLFIVRGVIMNAMVNLLIYEMSPDGIESINDERLIFVLFLIATFYVPYFKLFYRRLLAINFPLPRILTLVVFILIILVYIFIFPEKTTWYLEIFDLMMLMSIHIALLPWPDRICINDGSNI